MAPIIANPGVPRHPIRQAAPRTGTDIDPAGGIHSTRGSFVQKHAVAGLLAVAVAVLGGCGSPPSRTLRPPALRPIAVVLPPASISLLPVWLAIRDGGLARLGYRLAPTAHASLTIGPPGRWPIDAIIAWRPEWCLVTPGPLPFFRWRDLAQAPLLPVSGLSPYGEALVRSVLAEHGVRHVVFDVLGAPDATRLFATGHLPWLLLPLVPALQLAQRQRGHIAAFLGASTGPVPTLVVSGRGAGLRPLLAALNLALSQLAATPPASLTPSLAAAFPAVPRGLLTEAVSTAVGLSLWPPTDFPDSATYDAGRALLGSVGQTWPPYSAGVDSEAAREALTAKDGSSSARARSMRMSSGWPSSLPVAFSRPRFWNPRR